ncbi:MAG: SbcC/MukB-like Walker B domain-containing protein [Roseburia faecis]|uniref:SbcC/MukB-like Walker B domain-containing protein n=1 Tax=Roseburia faecis TaxID=301302 RepID=UPI001FAC0C51|nr:SbcC/MukB-like Walker B domain-containing protein [Roseburia faecis]
MSQAKKVFTRMCLNNWGGIDHKVLEFHEYVNLFSGKSGSGKSTVMDAIQVILYGSFSPSFLNKAADDAKNRRSVLSYLRGEQKDGSANRKDCDFCSVIALEIEDTGTHIITCIGIAFEVRKSDSEIKKFVYFSHSGKMPESEYLTEQGVCYSNQEIKKLVSARTKSDDNRGKGEVNRIYGSKEAYLGTLYDVILGYIDQNRFITMEKSAIALKMTNGTGQFIRDYMFPKNTSNTIATISEQLDSYRQIKEKIEDLRKRIELLSEIQASGKELVRLQTDIVRAEAMIRCIGIEDLRARIQAAEDDKRNLAEKQEQCKKKVQELSASREEAQQRLIQVSADLKASDLGGKQQQYEELDERSRMLADNTRQWQKILQGMKNWEEDDVITDYISNPVLNMIAELNQGRVTEELCQNLHLKIESAKQNIEDEVEDYRDQRREIGKQLKEKKRLVDDMKHDRKPYDENLRSARSALSQQLSDRYGQTVKVQIFADLFDVQEEEWKNAIEGRMGRLKHSLITEPQYAHEAAVLFRNMKQYENVDLINSKAIADSKPDCMEGSLYEAVKTQEAYVDVCLKRYLGHIIKCRSVEELEQVRDGVTPDCYSYSNFIFRHLKKKDYTTRACIGRRVSKARLAEYEKDVEELSRQEMQLDDLLRRLKEARDFECLKDEPSHYVKLSRAGEELARVNKKKMELEETIRSLREGAYKELEEKEQSLQKQVKMVQEELDQTQGELARLGSRIGELSGENESRRQQLEEKLQGYVPNEALEQEVWELLKKQSGQAVINRKKAQVADLEEKEQAQAETLRAARNRYIFAYPAGPFNGAETSNEAYEKLLEKYLTDFEPAYEEEFEKKCASIYKSLRENVIATIHGDIKAAKRHAYEINRLLRETNFSDSTYQIKIEPAKNENGQFFDMLMAEELDSKNLDNAGFDGQISFGEDAFYQKYEQKIKLLTDKFMPPKDEDEHLRAQKRKEMEQYADYRNYLSFSMFEQVTDENGTVIRENFVDDMAGRDSGGEGQNPKYVALLAGFAMLYMQQSKRDSKIKLVLLDEAFSKMDQERSAVCLKYARKMDLQLIVCVPDERLQSLIRNVDCVYGFRRYQNRISMMHIDKGQYLEMMEG